jgi:hypothetical protein
MYAHRLEVNIKENRNSLWFETALQQNHGFHLNYLHILIKQIFIVSCDKISALANICSTFKFFRTIRTQPNELAIYLFFKLIYKHSYNLSLLIILQYCESYYYFSQASLALMKHFYTECRGNCQERLLHTNYTNKTT